MLPTADQVKDILRNHPLVKFKGKILKIWIVGSYAKGYATKKSDIDILVKVPNRKISSRDLELKYRQKIVSFFVKNGIMGVNDSAHPNFLGKRIDIYFTYDERENDCILLS